MRCMWHRLKYVPSVFCARKCGHFPVEYRHNKPAAASSAEPTMSSSLTYRLGKRGILAAMACMDMGGTTEDEDGDTSVRGASMTVGVDLWARNRRWWYSVARRRCIVSIMRDRSCFSWVNFSRRFMMFTRICSMEMAR
ncbi:hypothetical protein H257_16167 [Aphanomyces astaci]|uniref:Uncharacterized protein n=1 Tax=Aphanomyces astaci TaxID=112090 RepID=W4FLE3_APHAT|nr:hypothetical protein H257_16167 [Aphanomyces astaci]ETV67701.1 hypothetical protein H257_16167 [Aphanomyces astaci]|eukprot:XP_009842822.1 hypothetical protein H257_16167 [Aphanomyces astaci]